jgi:hypothetical protein
MAPKVVAEPASLNEAIKVIVGAQLSSVTFVMDYWQLAFDGHCFSVMTKLRVTDSLQSTVSGSIGFRDHLCDQITKIVSKAEFVEAEALIIIFQDGTQIEASVRREDYRGVEALLFQSYAFKTLFVVN